MRQWLVSYEDHRAGSLARFGGFSLVEAIVVSALITLIFGALLSGVQATLGLLGHAKAEAGARSLAVSRLEYIRSLPYDEVGTLLGIPSGLIPQTSTSTLNGVMYTERVLIQYLDRDEDGFGVADDNGITEDSKSIKVEYTWTIRGETKSLSMVSDIIPPGIESTTGGGTLLINVFDASVQPVSGATVHVFNDSVATDTIDVTVTTNASGIANFPGAPARAGYQITVSKAGYSTDQTYSASTTNPSPNPPHVSVSVGAVSTVNFSIDRVSTLTLRAISMPVTVTTSDDFSSDFDIASSSGIAVSGGDAHLSDTAGVYQTPGILFGTTTTPTTIDSWQAFDFDTTATSGESVRVRLYSVTGSGTSSVYTLIPDADLPNNSVGFIAGPIDLTDVDIGTYGSLALGATLETTDTSRTPELHRWSLTYIESESPISGVTFSVVGDKSIGSNVGVAVPKFTTTVTTNGSGEATLTDLEWDAYDITINGGTEGYDIAESNIPIPYGLSPNVIDTLTVVLESHSPYSLRVTVTDTLGSAIPGASVHLYNGSVDETSETSIYGQVFFGSVASGTDYALDVAATGYDPSAQTNVSITSNVAIPVILSPEGSGGSTTTPATTTPPSNFLAGYNNRIPLTIAGTSLFGNVTDFPVYVNLANLPAGFFSAVQSDGDDIRITLGDKQTEVPREIVTINTGARTGELYFKAPSLLISTTSTFYLYYGHATATAYAAADLYGRNNVWSNNYVSVYHFEESQSGTGHADVYVDATGHGYDGDDYIAASGKTGKLGQGQEFDNANTDYIKLPYQSLNGRTDLTVSTWFMSSNDTIHPLLSGARSGEANEYLWWLRGDDDTVELFSHGDPREVYNISNIYTGSWRWLVTVLDDTANLARFYNNASEDNESPRTANVSTLSIASGGVVIGQDQDSVGGGFQSGQELDGYIDEMRISSTVRASGWLSNEYVNQNAPTSFYSIGSIESE